MNYMDLISRSFGNAWRYRFLWFFGFMVAVADIEELQWSEDEGNWKESLSNLGIDPGILISLGIVVITFWIVFWVLSVLSEGALIHGVIQKERGRETGFTDSWSAGTKHFLRLFGIMLLSILILLGALLAAVALVAPGFLLAAPVGFVLLILALPILVAVVISVICVQGWALRYAVVHNLPWLTSLKLGWNLFRTNAPQTLAVAFLSVLSQILIFCALAFCVAVMAVPFILVGLADFQAALWPGLLALAIVAVIAFAYTGTFASSMWTLSFLRLTERGARL